MLDLRWFDRGRFHFNIHRVEPDSIAPLRAALADPAFAKAKPSYHEQGVMDGGAVTLADMATHQRRIVVVNNPLVLPKPVSEATVLLRTLAHETRKNGRDAFTAPPEERALLVHDFQRDEESRSLTVFDDGRVELRLTHTTSKRAHAKRDYPSPRAVTGRANEGDLAALRDALSKLPNDPVDIPYEERGEGTVHTGKTFHTHKQPSPEMVAIQSVSEAIEASLEPL